MSKPGESVEQWRARIASSANGEVPAYVWCPWCKTRARGFRKDGQYMAYCTRCGKVWHRRALNRRQKAEVRGG